MDSAIRGQLESTRAKVTCGSVDTRDELLRKEVREGLAEVFKSFKAAVTHMSTSACKEVEVPDVYPAFSAVGDWLKAAENMDLARCRRLRAEKEAS